MHRKHIVERHAGHHGPRKTAKSPYGPSDGDPTGFGRECGIPARAATTTFLLSFLIAISGVSVPTHVTGLVMQTLVQTVLVYTTALSSIAYGAVGLMLCFAILDESTAVAYKKPGRQRTDSEFRKLATRLVVLNTLMMVLGAITVATEILLWYLLRGQSESDWMSLCSKSALATDEEVCSQMFLNQRIVLLMFGALLSVAEAMRFPLGVQFIRECGTETAPRLARLTPQEVREAREQQQMHESCLSK